MARRVIPGRVVTVSGQDDGYSAFKEITRDGFGELIAAIEASRVGVVIVRDIDRLTRNLTDWNAFEKACVQHGVRLSAYTGGDLDLSTPEGAYYGGMETLKYEAECSSKPDPCKDLTERIDPLPPVLPGRPRAARSPVTRTHASEIDTAALPRPGAARSLRAAGHRPGNRHRVGPCEHRCRPHRARRPGGRAHRRGTPPGRVRRRDPRLLRHAPRDLAAGVGDPGGEQLTAPTGCAVPR